MDERLLCGIANGPGESVEQQESEDPRRDEPRQRGDRNADGRGHEQHLRDELNLAVVIAVSQDASV